MDSIRPAGEDDRDRARIPQAISVVGLGRLGLGLAVTLARAGFDVLGVDIDEGVVRRVNSGQAPFIEPGLQEAMNAVASDKLNATADLGAAVAHGEIAFFLPATPSASDGRFQADQLRNALRDFCRAIPADTKQRHLLVIGSTVSPGTISNELIPAIEEAAGCRVGQRIGLCYNPELVSLGSMLDGFRAPDLVIIGESDRASGDAVEAIHRRIAANAPEIHRMSMASAEIAKLSLNNYLTVKISFANLLSQICSRIPGAELDKIIAALGADSRIGAKFLRPGNAFGGPCLPRDVQAFVQFARECGCLAGLPLATEAINVAQQQLLLDTVMRQAELAGARRIGVLGLAYKASTSFIEQSPAVGLIEALGNKNINCIVYDELALEAARAELDGPVFAESAAKCVDAAPVIVLMNAQAVYTDAIRSYEGTKPKIVIDCWRALARLEIPATVRTVGLGHCQWDMRASGSHEFINFSETAGPIG